MIVLQDAHDFFGLGGLGEGREPAESLVEPMTRGNPMKPLLWTSKSLRKLATELKKKGHEVSPTVVGNLLHEMDYLELYHFAKS